MNRNNLNTKSVHIDAHRYSSKRIKELADRLVFEFESRLNGYEIKVLSRLSMKYQGRATDRELSMIGDICDRVGIAGGIE